MQYELVVEFQNAYRPIPELIADVKRVITDRKHFFSMLSREVGTGRKSYDLRFLYDSHDEVHMVAAMVADRVYGASTFVCVFEPEYYSDHDFDIN